MSNQRRFVLLVCAFLCSAQTWNMDGEDKNIDEGLIAFIAKTREDAAKYADSSSLLGIANLTGYYGDVNTEDLKLMRDFFPAKKEGIRTSIQGWTRDETLSQERRKAWQQKSASYADVVNDLKESKVERLKTLTGKNISKNDMYAIMRSNLTEEDARNILIQDLADLRMFQEEMQQPTAWGRLSGLLKTK